MMPKIEGPIETDMPKQSVMAPQNQPENFGNCSFATVLNITKEEYMVLPEQLLKMSAHVVL